MKLSVCIVSWNVADLLEKCLASIYKHPPKCDFEVIVVDNNSNDGSVEMLKNYKPEPKGSAPVCAFHGADASASGHLRVIINPANLGFSAGNNQAIKASSGEYVLILNPDTEMLPGSLDALTEFLDKNPDAAIVAPKLLNTDGSLQRSCMGFPTLGAMAMRQLFIEQLWPRNPYSKKYLISDFKYDRVTEVDQPMGACLLIRRSVLDKVGLFDEHSFMFFDEVDLCYRIKNRGEQIYFTPDAAIIHHGGSSIKKWGAWNLSRHWTRGRNYYFRKHFGTITLAALNMFDIVRIVLIFGMLFLFYFIARHFLHRIQIALIPRSPISSQTGLCWDNKL